MTALLIATRNAHKVREIQQILPADYQYLTLHDFPGAPVPVEDGATFAANAAKKVSALADWLAANDGRAGLCRAVRVSPPHEVGRGSGREPNQQKSWSIVPMNSNRITLSPSPPPTCGGEGRGEEALFSMGASWAGVPPLPLKFHLMADDSGLEVDALGGAPGVLSARFAALDSVGADNSPDHANNERLLRLLESVPMARRTARFRCVLAVRELLLPSAAGTVLFEGVCEGRIGLRPAGGGGFGYDPLFILEGCSQSFAELGEAVKNSLSHRARALQKLRDYLAMRAGNP